MVKYAVVTGASTGLGRCIALELAGRKINTILAALPGEGLPEVCKACRDAGTLSEYFELDLADKEALKDFACKVNEKFEVNILVNNAGLGGSKRFGDVSFDYVNTIIQVNVAATSLLTHELLPNLKRNAGSYVLNISSMAGLIPTGYKTVYPASKAFIKHFSLGMREELKPDRISVSFAVLGPMPTKQEIISRINRQGFIGKALSVTPEKVAQVCVRQLFRKRRVIVPGFLNALSFHLVKLVPEYLRGILMSRSVKNHEL